MARHARGMLRPLSLATVLGLVALATSQPISAETLSGPAIAVDGDTLDMTGQRIRLLHIDAPESAQTCRRADADWSCGASASAGLAELVAGASVQCSSAKRDVYDRLLATCRAESFDVAELLLGHGLAIADHNAPEHYLMAEARAKGAKLGLWASEFQTPADWRKANPRVANAGARTSESRSAKPRSAPASTNREYRNSFGCAIKGNRSRRGEWIYHLPGQEYYEVTRPEELFCTEAAARAAGYRRAKA